MKTEPQIEITPNEVKLIPITKIESDILAIKEKCKSLKIESPTDKTGFNKVVENRKALKALNVLIEKNRKSLVEESVSWQKQVNSAARKLSAMVDEIKTPLEFMESEFILAGEHEKMRVEAEKQAKVQQRAEKILALNARYNGTHFILGQVQISQAAIEKLSDEDFEGELALMTQESEAILEADRLEKERQLAEKTRLEEERKELEALRAKLEEKEKALNEKEAAKGETAAKLLVNGTDSEAEAIKEEFDAKRESVESSFVNNLFPKSVMDQIDTIINNESPQAEKKLADMSEDSIFTLLNETTGRRDFINQPAEIIGEAITEPEDMNILFALEQYAAELYGSKPSLAKAFKEGALWMQEKLKIVE